MSAATWLLVAALVVLAVAAVALGVLLTRHVRSSRSAGVVIKPATIEGQWIATTPVGGAVITHVHDDDHGWSYEIETSFDRRVIDGDRERGDMVRLHYIAPSMAVTRRYLTDLVERHAAGLPQLGKTFAEIEAETESRF